MAPLNKTAAGIIIGDEILSGKVRDTNAEQLIAALAAAGVDLRHLVTIPDDPAVIAEEVLRCSERYDHVFTSGGLGPTHDDRTMEGIALAFGVAVERHPEIVRRIQRHWGGRINEAALKLAELPAGAELIGAEDGMLPVVTYRNLFILPGVPQIFAAKLGQLTARIVGQRRALKSIYLDTDETSIADHLGRVAAERPAVAIGSYPRLDAAIERVRVTVEAEDPGEVDRAVARLLELLPADHVVRVEG